jgi:hypothetical protein
MSDGREVIRLGPTTIVHDLRSNRLVCRFDKMLVLPVGSHIEMPGGYSVEVKRIRLLESDRVMGEPREVCLDVEMPTDWIPD